MLAVVNLGGVQLRFEEGKEYKINLPEDAEGKLSFDEVLLLSGDKVVVGDPVVKGASVEAEVISKKQSEKTRVFKFHSKKRYQRTKGQRQLISTVKILKINYEK